MIFQKCGRKPKNLHFYYQNQLIEIVQEYTYLGIKLTPNGNFTMAQKSLCEKALRAIFKIRKYTNISKLPHRLVFKIFDATVLPILTYGGEVWGVSKHTNFKKWDQSPAEKIHLKFCKHYLELNRKASNSATRSELGRLPIQITLVKKSLKYYSYLFAKAKLLGVSIDAELSWASHINDIIIPKVLRGLRILRTFRGTLPTEQLVSLYNALILPHFDYCSIIWGNCGLVLKNKLQVLQNRAARIITNSPYEVRSYKILNKLGWDNLEMRRNKQKSTLMYNIVKGNAPISLKDLFVRSKELHEYDLRSSAVDLKLPLPHTEFLKRSLSFGGAKLWNSLPSVIKNVDSFKLFKSSIAKFDF